MTAEVINPLRRRMIEDMMIRNFDPRTQQSYMRSVRACCRCCDRRPVELTFEDVRRYQLHLTQSGLAPASVNGAMVALRFFFRVTLKRPEAVDYIPIVREPQRLPVVLTPAEVASVLQAAPGLKWRTALSVAYGAGLRASEVVGLKIGDIDSQRMRIRVEQGKGRRDRDALLSPHLLAVLRNWWKVARPPVWLFPNRLTPFDPVTPRSLNRAFHDALRKAGIKKPVSLHTLRHCFATHLLEQDVDVRVIQVLLGHRKLETTAIYTHVAAKTLDGIDSPLDLLQLRPPPA
ncbi:MAG: site-specific integrase [Phenylobacterium sp.]|uniref:tyrosine-type recombinase/integrase n=1 Tax=Phenylobacterium sp. TaxID=1871053 RepID=UPI002734D49C|nr:site-specific integrase [Phenylobacterium sp.]MDP3748592.1 site-specific integrase [Phenylobacterium sp.]